VVVLDELPLTVNGKVDRAALPAPERDRGGAGRAPATPTEEVLCSLFTEVLGVEQVSAEDSFFELGGDSITSMILVARARRAGLVLAAWQVFEHRTPAALAVNAEQITSAPAALDVPTGTLQLTPVMSALLHHSGEAALTGALFQSMQIAVPAGLDLDRLVAALRVVLNRHAIMRARLEPPADEGDGWRLRVPPSGDGPLATGPVDEWVRRVDVAGMDGPELQRRIAEESRAAGDRLDPVAGLMVQAVWCDAGPEAPGRLLLAAHHLAVDGVSWRILLPDLEEAYAEPEGRSDLPAGVSFRHWARQLAAQATSPERTAELPAWMELLQGPDPVLGDHTLDPRQDLASTMRRAGASIAADTTAALVTGAQAAFGAGVDDVLLCSFVVALAEWRRRRGDYTGGGVLVEIEGHGREPLSDGMDLSRTVGWFTSAHPVRLDPGAVESNEMATGGPTVARVLKRIKEQLRQAPGDGLGFGMLRYLNQESGPELARLPVPQIGFNYLGRFGGAGARTPAGLWQPAGDEPLGGGAPAEMAAPHLLELAAMITDGPDGPRLQLTIMWPQRLLSPAAVDDLVAGWQSMLGGIATHLAATDSGGGQTPSDFPLADIDQDELDELEMLAHQIEGEAR
jgi:non-ribosomal peptide synthase protein (TIGR01720 family)